MSEVPLTRRLDVQSRLERSVGKEENWVMQLANRM